jgi:hypothetical protein
MNFARTIKAIGVLEWIDLAVIVVFVIICMVYGGRGSGDRRSGRSSNDTGGMPPGGDVWH